MSHSVRNLFLSAFLRFLLGVFIVFLLRRLSLRVSTFIESQTDRETTLLRHIAFMRNVFCFNGFNQAPIVLRYSAHIKPRKRLKPLDQTTFTHNHNMTLIVSSQSIAVNK